jgi:hypothetical protein
MELTHQVSELDVAVKRDGRKAEIGEVEQVA